MCEGGRESRVCGIEGEKGEIDRVRLKRSRLSCDRSGCAKKSERYGELVVFPFVPGCVAFAVVALSVFAITCAAANRLDSTEPATHHSKVD